MGCRAGFRGWKNGVISVTAQRCVQIEQKKIMKLRITILTGAIMLALGAITAKADDKKPAPKPDKMTTCPVSGDKLGEMGKPYIFEYKGREVKLCCPDCKKDFEKDPAKYMKKIEAADKETAKPAPKDSKK